MRQLRWLSVLLALLAPICIGQSTQMVQFKVILLWSNGSSFGDKQDVSGMPGVQGTSREGGSGQPVTGNSVSNMSIRIAILNDVGQTIAEASPSSQGDATFNVIAAVTNNRGLRQSAIYRVRVTGSGIEEENIENVEPGSQDRVLTVKIRRKGEKGEPGGGVISADSLKIPKKAEKEYERGNKALEDKKLPEAKDHFERAVALYPQYDVAYNGLGATLLQLGDVPGGQQAFEKSIQVNDKFAGGYRNLALIAAQQKDFVKAAAYLEKSLSLEPLNPDALSRLCQFDYILGKDTAVPELAKKVHSVPHTGQELAHFAAASSLERMNKPDEAIGEYTLFLKEAPQSNLAPNAKAGIERCRQKLNEPSTQ